MMQDRERERPHSPWAYGQHWKGRDHEQYFAKAEKPGRGWWVGGRGAVGGIAALRLPPLERTGFSDFWTGGIGRGWDWQLESIRAGQQRSGTDVAEAGRRRLAPAHSSSLLFSSFFFVHGKIKAGAPFWVLHSRLVACRSTNGGRSEARPRSRPGYRYLCFPNNDI
jgi:hypothetical protein